jgi:alpha-glucan,water dikinase
MMAGAKRIWGLCAAGIAAYVVCFSVPVVPLTVTTVEAASEGLMWDAQLRSRLVDSIVDVGQAVEDAFGGVPQDIEGVWREGQLVVVQARPQVLPDSAA